MTTVKHHKVVAALPAVLEPNSIYYVRAGSGFDQYVTNGAGLVVASPLNADVRSKLLDPSGLPAIRPSLRLDFLNYGDRLDPRITFTRSTGGGRRNSQGQYEWLPANAPRIDYDPVTGECRGLLIEEQRTNLLTYSSDFANAVWLKSGATIELNALVSPDGGLNADKLVESANNESHTISSITIPLTIGAAYTFSIFVKAAERSIFRLVVTDGLPFAATVSLIDGTVTGSVGAIVSTYYGNGWWRLSGSAVATSASAVIYAAPRITTGGGTSAYTGDGTSGIYIWGAQLEAGSFPTTYIPTTNAQVTRAADIASVNELSPWFNPEAGTFVIESTNRQLAKGGTFGLSIGSSSSNYIGAPYHTTSGVSASVFANVGGVSKGLSIPQNPDKVAFSYGSDGVIALAAGGVSDGSMTHAALPSFSSLLIGRGHFGGLVAPAHYKSIRYFPRKLSDSELQALTA